MLADKAVLVTGASSGLGAHFARVLAEAGAHVALAARREEECARLAAELRRSWGRKAVAIALDVTDPASVAAGCAQAEAELGGVDILVNNAGVAQVASFLKMTLAQWRQTFDVNLDGAFTVAQEVARLMQLHGTPGAIVNVASITGLRVARGIAAYAASKAALIHLTRAMALELARYDIRVNALCPGYIETDLNRDFFASDAGREQIGRIPMGRLGVPRDLDGPLLLLCSDGSRYMTGSTLVVDGGHLQSPL